MNLLGLKKIGGEQKLTLDKVNKKIRAEAKSNNLNLSIMQSHNEAKVVSHIQKNRNKLDIKIDNFSKLKFSSFFKNYKEFMNIIEHQELIH